MNLYLLGLPEYIVFLGYTNGLRVHSHCTSDVFVFGVQRGKKKRKKAPPGLEPASLPEPKVNNITSKGLNEDSDPEISNCDSLAGGLFSLNLMVGTETMKHGKGLKEQATTRRGGLSSAVA